MKTWLAQFRISKALDSGEPLPKSLRARIADSNDLRRFQERSTALAQRLQKTLPATEPPVWLHGGIMRAVNTASGDRPRNRKQFSLPWLAAPAAAMLVLGLWWCSSGPELSPGPLARADVGSLEAAGVVLGMSDDLAKTAPVALVSPLAEEWDRLRRDIDRAAQALLASVPAAPSSGGEWL